MSHKEAMSRNTINYLTENFDKVAQRERETVPKSIRGSVALLLFIARRRRRLDIVAKDDARHP